MLTIVLAAALGLFGVVAVVAYANHANERAVAGQKAETVVFATNMIPAGTSLSQARKANWLSTEEVPASSLSTPPVTSSTSGHLVFNSAVPTGQVLLQNMLTTASNASFGASSLPVPAKDVAVTVNMCVAEAVASYLTRGSHIAVFDTIASKGSTVQRSCDAQHQILNANAIANNAAETRLVLPNAEVLAVGQNPAAQGTSQANTPTATADPASSAASSNTELLVTVAVTQEEAEKLILIDEVGMPYMALLGSQASISFTPPGSLFQP